MSLVMRMMAPLMDKHTVIQIVTASLMTGFYVMFVDWVTWPECLSAKPAGVILPFEQCETLLLVGVATNSSMLSLLPVISLVGLVSNFFLKRRMVKPRKLKPSSTWTIWVLASLSRNPFEETAIQTKEQT